ncbi:GNAT family N-acetyltransferase [Lentibacillus sp. Marseille-P4043]|uniref:GNAT family N-acetyltransferase n=1 Tax=Lentibacillus sp. Marseille-P4043 TaxID=2040293 RepID=UPI000D0BD7B0|nr:GNAT family N-acetyltransferase [Lentibacillus sp. Marseille-P4043]
MYKLREARMEDFPMISELSDNNENIHLAADEGEMGKDLFETILVQDDTRFYLVEKSGVIAAFLVFRIDLTANEFQIQKLSIVSSYENKGLDEHLYQKMEKLAKQKDVERLITTITTKNPNVHQFFSRKGWVKQNGVYVLNMNE